MQCPKCSSHHFRQTGTDNICYICGFLILGDLPIEKPMTRADWKAKAKQDNCEGPSARPRRKCAKCDEIRPIQTADGFCWRCEDRRKKRHPFEGVLKKGRKNVSPSATLDAMKEIMANRMGKLEKLSA